jgi:hypothetical protein
VRGTCHYSCDIEPYVYSQSNAFMVSLICTHKPSTGYIGAMYSLTFHKKIIWAHLTRRWNIWNKTKYRKDIAKPLEMGKICKTIESHIITVLLSSSSFFDKERILDKHYLLLWVRYLQFRNNDSGKEILNKISSYQHHSQEYILHSFHKWTY